jgi:hypothetical protein
MNVTEKILHVLEVAAKINAAVSAKAIVTCPICGDRHVVAVDLQATEGDILRVLRQVEFCNLHEARTPMAVDALVINLTGVKKGCEVVIRGTSSTRAGDLEDLDNIRIRLCDVARPKAPVVTKAPTPLPVPRGYKAPGGGRLIRPDHMLTCA